MNKRLRLAVRQASCELCTLHTDAEGSDRCVTGNGPNDARLMVVTKTPLTPESRLRSEMVEYLKEAGIDVSSVMWCSAIKCLTWNMDATKTHQKACLPYLRQEIAHVQPQFVLALGAEAWFAASGWADITKHRGGTYNLPEDCQSDAILFPTISPSAVARSPHLRQGFVADLKYLARLMNGADDTPPFHHPGDRAVTVDTKDRLRDTLRAIRASTVVAWDIETSGDAPWEPDGFIVSISLTTAIDEGMDTARVWRIPLYHPESPWKNQWRNVLAYVGRELIKIKRNGGHNIKYDAKWMRCFGVDIEPGWDTIIILALLDENQPKGLKPTCQQRLGADPWGIDTKNLLDTPLAEVLEYNGLDTWHNLRLYFMLRKELLAVPKLAKLYAHLMMPLVRELTRAEIAGVFVDGMALAGNWGEVQGKLQAIHELLMEHVPDPSTPGIPDNLFDRKGNLRVNFNASNFARWWLFEYLDLPVLARGKKKDDGSPGAPSMAEDLMADIADQTNHEVPKLMVERVQWNKYDTAFFRPWSNQITREGRIHTVFKPWGTVTGRLSSGKEDAEKITAGARNRKGVNMQQVPRNKLARGVFGAPPGSKFIEADYSQIELRIAAYLSRERRMMHLYATGQDIHLATAMQMTGKPADQITPEERKKAKAVNFGFLYGMGWTKFIHTAWANYGVRVSEQEARAFREAFFQGFPGLLPWHARQRKLVRKYGRVETPMGRIRHLPDIFSPDRDVQAEAERQAINSPVQAMASDMAALSLVHCAKEFRRLGLKTFVLGPVHDAVNFEAPNEELHIVLPLIKNTMENLPLDKLFDLYIDVPIIADVKIGQHWSSDAIEVPSETVTSPSKLNRWIKENVS